jgi:hypothetical protein
MMGQRLFRMLAATCLLASACTPRLAPETNRRNVTIEVTNPTALDLNVTVEHVGGVWALGKLPAFKTRLYQIRLLQDQPVFVVGANLWGLQELRQTVYLSAGCMARVVLVNAPSTAPLAGSNGNSPTACAA